MHNLLPLVLTLALLGMPTAQAAELTLALTDRPLPPSAPAPPIVCGTTFETYEMQVADPNASAPAGKAFATFSLPGYSCPTEFRFQTEEALVADGHVALRLAYACEKHSLGPGRVAVLGGPSFRISLSLGGYEPATYQRFEDARPCEPGKVHSFEHTFLLDEATLIAAKRSITMTVQATWLNPDPRHVPVFYFRTGGEDGSQLIVNLENGTQAEGPPSGSGVAQIRPKDTAAEPGNRTPGVSVAALLVLILVVAARRRQP